jgi:hypothetical protein
MSLYGWTPHLTVVRDIGGVSCGLVAEGTVAGDLSGSGRQEKAGQRADSKSESTRAGHDIQGRRTGAVYFILEESVWSLYVERNRAW